MSHSAVLKGRSHSGSWPEGNRTIPVGRALGLCPCDLRHLRVAHRDTDNESPTDLRSAFDPTTNGPITPGDVDGHFSNL